MKGGRNHFGKTNGTPEIGKNSGNSNLHDGRWDQAFHPKGRNKRTVWEIPLSKFRIDDCNLQLNLFNTNLFK
jgi:site-specific DNA-methyltransferase (adenine-specific)